MADTSISPAAGQLRLASRRPQIINLSALTNARSGVARSGITRSGYTSATITEFQEFLDVTVHDDHHETNLDVGGDARITLGLNSEPSTLTARIIPRGTFPIRKGMEIKIYQGGIDTGVPLFAGTILNFTQMISRQADYAEYVVEAVDYRWLLDRFSLVSKFYRQQGINTIIADILANNADPSSGFVTGYIPQSLGTVNWIEFDNVRITEALDKLAQTVDGGAFWEIGFKKQISMYAEPHDEGNTITVGESGTWRHLERFEDLSQTVNRVIFVGGGSHATARVEPDATTIPVAELGWYNPDGGDVRAPCQTISYTGKEMGSGAGNLTGVTGVTIDIEQGQRIYNLSQQDDTAAQTDLAADLGGGQSGVAVHQDSDHRFGYERTVEAAKALLDLLKTPNTGIRFDEVPDPDTTDDNLNHIRPGRLATLAVTTPETIAGSFRIRMVTIVPHSRRADGSLVFARHVDASRNRRSLTETLKEALA